MADRKPQEKAPNCRGCDSTMTRVYRYKKITNSKNGKWEKLGWACANCEIMLFVKEKKDGTRKRS